MKLKKVTNSDPTERLVLSSVHKSVLDDLKRYQDMYKEVHGDEIPMNLLVEEMLKGFMQDDKNFAKFKLARANAEAPDSTKSST